jgi:hypothetical protein
MPYTGTAVTSANTTSYTGNSSVIWTTWTQATTSTGSITVPYLNNVWTGWNSGTNSVTATAGGYYSANTVWTNWNGMPVARAGAPVYVAPPETEAARTARVEREARWAEERVAQAAEREASNRRAEALLQAHLTPDQQRQLAQEDWFMIDSKSGKKYRINRGRSANIDVLDETGKVVRSLCVHPGEAVPDADTMLSQALMLKHDEEALLRIANVHGINHGFRRRPLVQPAAA